MIEVLNHIDDVKKIRKLIIDGMTQDAIKACDVSIAHNEKKVKEFEKWAEEESKKDVLPEGVGQYTKASIRQSWRILAAFLARKVNKNTLFLKLAISRRLWYSV